LSYESEYIFLKPLDTPLMPISDEYGAQTSILATPEFLWALF
jgi:hypothetical protein